MKTLLVAGARPNFMKIAPLVRAIESRNRSGNMTGPRIDYRLVHTGQHYDIAMSEVFFRDLELPKPDVNLEVGSGSHAVQTANIMIRFEDVCLGERPDWVLVVGDVNSTMACALVAAKLGIRVGHVEAGLRSFDRAMPEEINRIITDALADLLFTPSREADENLLKEGIPAGRVKFVGNVMIDTLVAQLDKARLRKAYAKYGLREKGYAFVTLHRPSNIDDAESLGRIMESLSVISLKVPVIFPVHPRTRKRLDSSSGYRCNGNLNLVEPLGYHDCISLVEQALFVLTDSGGLQEESTFLGIPCLTLRPNTERPVTITHGTNRLTSLGNLERDVSDVFTGNHGQRLVPEMWDGMAAERIVSFLVREA